VKASQANETSCPHFLG